MSASRLSLEQMAVYNYLKYEIVSPNFSEQVSGDSLTYDASLGGYVADATNVIPSPVSNGRGWVFFDDSLVDGSYIVNADAEQSSKVVVAGASSYTLDYARGVIKNPNTVPTAVSYYWNYVAVLKHWPGVTPPELPFVTIGIESSIKRGLQLGGGTRNIRSLYVDVFATSALERDDITDVIHTALFNRTITIKDFSGGGYLNYDGTFNSSLVLPLGTFGHICTTDTSSRVLRNGADWTDINKFRSVISCTYESIVE